MKILSDIGLLFKRKVLEMLREPVWIISEFSMPLLYLALFAPLLQGLQSSALGDGNVLDAFVPGLLALFAFSSGMGEGWTVIWEIQTGVIERFRVCPVSRFALLMGAVIRDVLTFILSAVMVIFISCLFGFQGSISGIIILLALLSLLTAVVSATSSSLGMILKNIGALAAVVTSLQLPITLLSGVLLPLSVGPVWLQMIAHLNPMYYVVEASRVLAAGTLWDSKVLEAFAVMIPLTVIALWWSTRVYRKAVA